MTHTEESLMALADEYARLLCSTGHLDGRSPLRLAIRGVLADKQRLALAVLTSMDETNQALNRAERAEAELAVYKDAKKPPLEQSQSNCLVWMNRCLNAEAECERLRSLLKQVEWTPQGKCPVCLGWEVIKGQGECYRVHTKTCALHAAIKDQP